MAKFGIGQPVRRVEDQRFLIGKGRYVDDIVLPGMAFGVNVLSPHAHARIKKVDVSKAKAAPGVLAVLTGADVAADKLGGMTAHLMPEDFGAPKGHRTFLPLLVADKVRCVGDRVAFVVAETEAQARDAAELVAVEYEPLPAVVNIEDAAKEGAPKVHDDNNMGNTAFRLMFGNQEATDAAFAKAKHVVKLRVENNRRVAGLDGAARRDRRLRGGDRPVHAATPPRRIRMACAWRSAHIFHVPENQIRVISPDVGGGFGLKGGAYPDDLLVMWASKKLRRPVKWVASRSESMMNDAPRPRDGLLRRARARRQRQDPRAALEVAVPDGRLVRQRGARRRRVLDPLRARGLRHPDHAPDVAGRVHQHLDLGAVPRRRPAGGGLFHGAADRACRARRSAWTRAEIRRRNLIPPSKLPYTTPTHWVYDSGEFVKLMDTCIAHQRSRRATPRACASRKKNGKLRGRAVSYYIEFGGIFNDRMELRFDPSGALTVYGGTHSHGQGHATVFAQIAHEFLGVPFEQIKYVQGDTAQVAIGRGTYGARSAVVGGSALKRAADNMIEKGKERAAAMMEADAGDIEFKDGTYRSAAPTRRSRWSTSPRRRSRRWGRSPSKFGIGLEAEGSFSPEPPSHPNGCHVCEVEVDPETGEVELDRYHVVDDLGRILNPMIVLGQMQGGAVQGIGQALMEHQVYDRHSGQLLTGSFMDYAMPQASHAAERRRQDGGDRLQDQSARRQGHRRERHHRRAADHHQRADRRAAAARRRRRSTCRRRRCGCGRRSSGRRRARRRNRFGAARTLPRPSFAPSGVFTLIFKRLAARRDRRN